MLRHPPQPAFRPRNMLLVVALGLALTAQYLFTGEWLTRFRDSNGWEWLPNYTLASILLLVAVACAGWAVTAQPASQIELSAPLALPTRSFVFVIAALACLVVSSAIYLAAGENLIVQLLWVASGVIFAVGLWRTAPPSMAWAWAAREHILVIALMLTGSVLRFWELGQLPAHIDNDIPWVGTVALDLIAAQDYRWLGYAVEAAHLQSYVQFYAWSMRLFGQNLFGLIVTSAIAGTLTLPVVYALGRELYGARVGLIAMALLSFSYTHIHFSRTMFGPKATLFATLTLYLIFRGLRRREPIWFGLGGLAAGIGVLFYDSSRVIPFVCLVALAWWLIWQRDQLRANQAGIVLFGVGALVGFGPMLSFALTRFDEFLGRGHDITIWSPAVWEHATSVYGVTTVPEVMLNQIMRASLTFHLYGDGSPQFAFPRPMVDALTAALLVVGFGVLARRMRDLQSFGLIMWVGATLVFGGVLTYDPPFWPHLNIALPAVVLIAAAGAEALFAAVPARARQWGQPALLGCLCIAIGLTAIHSWRVYYAFASDNAGPRNRMSQAISDLPPGYAVFLVSDEYSPDNYAFRFLNRGVPIIRRAAAELLQSPPPLDQPLFFVVHQHDEVLPALMEHYPTAELQSHMNRDGVELFRTLRVAPPNYPPLEATPTDASRIAWVMVLLLGCAVGWAGHSWFAGVRARDHGQVMR